MMREDLLINCIAYFCVAIFAMCIKYIDDVRDEHCFGGRYINAALLIGNLAVALAMLLSSSVQIIILAIVIGCFLGKKLDVWEFQITGVFIITLAVAIELCFHRMIKMELCMWVSLAFIDEILNNQSDRMKDSALKWLFKNKVLMPLTALFIMMFNMLLWERFVVIAIFDLSYCLVPLCQKAIKVYDPVCNNNIAEFTS